MKIERNMKRDKRVEIKKKGETEKKKMEIKRE